MLILADIPVPKSFTRENFEEALKQLGIRVRGGKWVGDQCYVIAQVQGEPASAALREVEQC